MFEDNLQKNNAEPAPASARTLADTIVTVRGSSALTPRQKIESVSAINSLCRALGRQPQFVNEELAAIRQAMASANPGRIGIARNTWANIKSKVMRCLRLCGHRVLCGLCKTTISPAWHHLLSAIPVMPHKTRMTRLVRWCSEQDIEPCQFDQQSSEAFRMSMRDQHPKHAHHNIYLANINMWRRCQREFASTWPQAPIAPYHLKKPYTYPPATFSANFNADVDAMMLEATKPSLGRRTGRKGIKSSTAAQRRRTVYRLASIVARQRGVEPHVLQSLAEIVDPAAFDGALDFIAHRVGREQTGDLYRLARTVRGLARHWVGAPEDHLKQLAHIQNSVRPRKGPADKTIDLLRLFRDPRLQEHFLLMPEIAITRLRRKKAPSRADAVTAQLAMMSSILVGAPLRSANAVTLREGDNLLSFGTGRNRSVRITIGGDVVKNGMPLDFLLRPGIVDLIEAYNKKFRPIITKDKTGYLCPGRRGGHKRPTTLSQQLAKFTSRELGVKMTAHQWRHIVGYIFLIHNPGQYEPVRRMLGHTSIITTQTYYAFLLDEDAQVLIDETFEALRQQGRRRLGRKNLSRRRSNA